ncbi:hypothetical protein FRC10_003295 [Ceratobasidium sp. 414]|nr:hypothetical protein FRC10_003295 [Ceratobasidium sp. 414]
MFQNNANLDRSNGLSWLRRNVPGVRGLTTVRINEGRADYFMIITRAGDDPRAIIETSEDAGIRNWAVSKGVPAEDWVVHQNPYPARS